MTLQRSNIFISIFTLSVMVTLAGSVYVFHSHNLIGETYSLDKSIKKEKVAENLKSFFNNKNDYEEVFAKSQNIPKQKISVGIISHHFLAKEIIARFYSGIENNLIENVIIIGPDHFGAFESKAENAYATLHDWETPYGNLKTNQEVIERLVQENSDVVKNDGPFRTEHAIYTQVPFIKKVFPGVHVVPLIVNNKTNYQKLIELGKNLHQLIPKKSLLVVSSDFSHDASLAEAKQSDQSSIMSLKNLNEENISKVNCDCRACLAVILGFIGRESSPLFYLNENKTSADFGGSEKNVTSYISGYYLVK